MLKIVIAAVAGVLCLSLVSAPAAYSDAGAGGFAAKHPRLAEKFQNLPQWQKDDIKKVVRHAHMAVKAVRSNPKLTAEQKETRIAEIKKHARERISKILHSTEPLRGHAGAK